MDLKQIKQATLAECGIKPVNSGVYWGEWAPVAGRDLVEIVSPIDGQPIAKVAMGTAADYEKVVKAAEAAYRKWSDIPAPRRGEIVAEIGKELIHHKKALGMLVTLEVGKTISEGQGEIQEIIDIGHFATGLSRQLYGLTIASERKDHRLMEQWQPLGVIGVITSFNFPTAVWGWNALLASVVGDTVVWKPSTKAPLIAIATMNIVNKVFEKNGIDPIFFLICGRGASVGDWMAFDARLPLISFTGSVNTGKNLSEKLSKRLGKSLLELGGNNAVIVTENADFDIALKGVTFGALATAGQRCTSTRRLILHESVYAEFLKRLVKAYKSVSVGNPMEPATLVGPLVDGKAVDAFLSAIDEAKKEGGKVAFGGGKADIKGLPKGHYVTPTIIEAKPSMKITSEETFAPILYVFKYSKVEEAIAIQNGVPQGLSSSIFTKDLREAELFLSHKGSDCGLANVNTGTAGAEIGGAFGGEKDTGGGRESGSDSWKYYCRRQTVTVNYGKDLPLAQGVKFDI